MNIGFAVVYSNHHTGIVGTNELLLRSRVELLAVLPEINIDPPVVTIGSGVLENA
jgi:hypothetical protein